MNQTPQNTSTPNSTAVIDPGYGWRLLEEGEPLKPGDGYLAPDLLCWIDFECRPALFRGGGREGSWYHVPKRDYAHTWPWRRKIEASRPKAADSVPAGDENQGADQVSENPRAVQGQWHYEAFDGHHVCWRNSDSSSTVLFTCDTKAGADSAIRLHNASLKDDKPDLDLATSIVQGVARDLLWLNGFAQEPTDFKTKDAETAWRERRQTIRDAANRLLKHTSSPTPQASEVVEEEKEDLGEPGGV